MKKAVHKKGVGARTHDSVWEHAILIFVAILHMLPLAVMVLNSFREEKRIKLLPISLPESLYFKNYPNAWKKGQFLTGYLNSFFIGVIVVICVLVLGGLCAYSMAKLPLPKHDFFVGYFTMGMAIPGFLCLVPLYFMMGKIGMTNSRYGLSMIYVALFLPLHTMMMRAYLIGIPRELEEAGKIDGCSELGVFWHVTLPLARPIMTTVALLVFSRCWNEFLWANTFLSVNPVRTVATRFYIFVSEHNTEMDMIYTSGVISLAPIAVLYLLLQDNFIEGLTAGGVKG